MSEQQKTKVREFWFDIDTTSENDIVVHDLHMEKPDFETEYHVIEHSAYQKCVEALKKYKNQSASVQHIDMAARDTLKELGEDSECPVIKSREKK